jgi:YD repeat-containing protein
MTDGTGTTAWGFDNADRLTSVSAPQGNVSYTLDNAGRRTAMTEPCRKFFDSGGGSIDIGIGSHGIGVGGTTAVTSA